MYLADSFLCGIFHGDLILLKAPYVTRKPKLVCQGSRAFRLVIGTMSRFPLFHHQ